MTNIAIWYRQAKKKNVKYSSLARLYTSFRRFKPKDEAVAVLMGDCIDGFRVSKGNKAHRTLLATTISKCSTVFCCYCAFIFKVSTFKVIWRHRHPKLSAFTL